MNGRLGQTSARVDAMSTAAATRGTTTNSARPGRGWLGAGLLAGLAVVLAPASAAAQTEVVEYYATDAVGSIRVVFDSSGEVRARSDYLPFGEAFNTSGKLPSQRFTGQERDGEAGLDNFNARAFDGQAGRFNRPDPVAGTSADPQSWNRYAYVFNNPLTFTDPTGMTATFGTRVTVDTRCNPNDPNALSGVKWCPPTYSIIILPNDQRDPHRPPSGPQTGRTGGSGSTAGSGTTGTTTGDVSGAPRDDASGVAPRPSISPEGPEEPCTPPTVVNRSAVERDLDAMDRAATRFDASELDQRLAAMLGTWLASVSVGGQFDHVSKYKTGAARYSASHTGNFSYGATGARVGLPLPVLRVGSAVAAIAFSWGQFDAKFRLDERRDQFMVIRGYQYYVAGCHGKK